MGSETNHGLWVVGEGADTRTAESRVKEFEATFLALASKGKTVEQMFDAATEALTEAELSVRVADPDGGWKYAYVPDHAIRLAAFEKLAKVLRLMPQGGQQVTVNANTQTINVSAEQRVAELDSIGVPREVTREACLAMIDATDKSPVITPATPKLG